MYIFPPPPDYITTHEDVLDCTVLCTTLLTLNEFSDKNTEPSMKALKKEDIIAHYTSLQAKYSILEQKNIVFEKEKITHIEAIRLLEETVNVLEKKTSPNNVVDKQTKES